MLPEVLAPAPDRSFVEQMKVIDKRLEVKFHCGMEKWMLYRYDRRNNPSWVMTVENEDGSYRKLDNRTLKKLREMDIIARWGSVDAYEKHLDEKYNKWHADEKARMDHEVKCDLLDDKVLWQRAIENAQSGIINSLPEEKRRKIFTYK